jgi:glycine/D-amino acid oxidase-like deaminating enzyme
LLRRYSDDRPQPGFTVDSIVRSDRWPVTFADALPASVDVVVIGAGVIGITTAWFLHAAGASVLVCEKGVVAGEQSSRNWGWIRQQARDAAEVPIAIDSVNLWEQLAREVGEDIGFKRGGIVYAARTERELARFARWLPIAERHQLDTRMLTASEVDALIDDKPGQWAGGMVTASDARAEPAKAVPALARAVHARGVAIREYCAVRSLDVAGGRVVGVVTERGRMRASAVVCAAGAWSTRFLGNLDVDLPQLAARATVARTAPVPSVCDVGALLGEIAIRRRPDGGYSVAASSLNEHFVGADTLKYFREFLPALRSSRRFLDVRFGGDVLARLFPQRHWRPDEVTPFERTRVWDPSPSADAVDALRAGLAKRLPKLAGVPIVEAWAGMIDTTPDVVPVIDAVADYPGLYVATGFSGHGFGIGPGAGRVVADMVLGKPARHDLTRFRLARFRDGAVEVGPSL